jgi:hypothetical protein
MKKLLAVLVVTAALLGCQRDDPRNLTRDRAATLIKQAPAFQKLISVNFYLQPRNPQNLVARHLGYLDPDQLALTERGRQLWRDLSLPVDEHSVPVARAELDEVTGITTSGNAADGHFTWHWIPNDLGKTLIIDSPEFKALPDDLQTKIRQPPPAMTPAFATGNSGLVFGGMRSGTANLQLYDDGWRVTHVYLF